MREVAVTRPLHYFGGITYCSIVDFAANAVEPAQLHLPV